MTKLRDVNKCRQQEKYEMAALIRQANKQYKMANKPKIKKKERLVKKEGKRERKQQQHLLKKKEASNVSGNRTKAGYM